MSDVGRQIDRYVIEAELGAGGFGAVYRARHHVIGTAVALKVLSPQHAMSPTMVERFLREAKTAAAIGNPHIVGVTDAGVSEGRPFLAMELLEGEDLETRLARAGAIPIGPAIDIVLQVLEALGAAHRAGIVHRDMKPANVFLTQGTDERPLVKLLDFGISKVVEPGRVSALTQAGAMLGTPAYMAPEQITDTRQVDARADLYAVAVILFEMLTGRLPYRADSLSDLIRRAEGLTPDRLELHRPEAPPALGALIAQNLSPAPEARSADAEALAAALREIRAGVPDHPLSVRLAAPRAVGGASPFAAPLPAPSAPTPPYGGVSGPPPPIPGAYYGAPPVMAPAAREEGRSIGPWIAIGLIALALPAACLVGGFAAFTLSDDDTATPVATPTPPPYVPPSAPGNPTAPPPNGVVVSLPPGAPAPAPPPPPPDPFPLDGPLVAPPIAEGAAACDVPVLQRVECDRAWDRFEPTPCELRRERELHVIAAYSGGAIRLDVARTAAPLVLVLSSYSPVTWTLRVAEGVRIEEILTVGRGAAEVEGAPPGTRVRSGGRGYPIMGWAWEGFGTATGWSGRATAQVAERDLGLPMRAFVGCYEPTRFVLAQ